MNPWFGFHYVFMMHGGAHARAGHPSQVQDISDTVWGHSQLFSGPSLSIPGIAGSLKNIYPLFRG